MSLPFALATFILIALIVVPALAKSRDPASNPLAWIPSLELGRAVRFALSLAVAFILFVAADFITGHAVTRSADQGSLAWIGAIAFLGLLAIDLCVLIVRRIDRRLR